jgi:hypothetical protein
MATSPSTVRMTGAVDHVGRLADQMAHTLITVGGHTGTIEKHHEGFSMAAIRENREGAIASYYAVCNAADGIETAVGAMRTSLEESADFIDAAAWNVFQKQLAPVEEKQQRATRVRGFCLVDIRSGEQAMDQEALLLDLAKTTAGVIERSRSAPLPEAEVRDLCKRLDGANRFIADLTASSDNSHPDIKRAIAENKAQFEALVAQMEAAFGREKVRGIVFPEEVRLSPSALHMTPPPQRGHWENENVHRVSGTISTIEFCESDLAEMPAELDADGIARQAELMEAILSSKAALSVEIAELPPVLRDEIYDQILALSPEPKGGPNWGKENLTTNMAITKQAFENALEAHSEFEPRWVEEEAGHPSAFPHFHMGPPHAMPMGSFPAMPVMRWENGGIREMLALVDDAQYLSGLLSGDSIPTARPQLEARLAEMKAEIAERTAALPAAFRNEVYGQIYALSPPPKGGHNWGEKNLTKDLDVTMQAFRKTLENKPEFQPRLVEEEAEYSPGPLHVGAYQAMQVPQWKNLEAREAMDIVYEALDVAEMLADVTTEASRKPQLEAQLAEMKAEIARRTAALPVELRNEVYGQIYALSPPPKGGHNWGENNLTKDLNVTMQAFRKAFENKPEFAPRLVFAHADGSESDGDREVDSPFVGSSYAAAEAVETPAPTTALEILDRLAEKLQKIKDDDSIDALVQKGFTTLAFEEAKRQLQEVDHTNAGAILDSIYGLVYEYREDKSQGGHEWGKNHACDSAAVLWAAVVNETVNLDPSFT